MKHLKTGLISAAVIFGLTGVAGLTGCEEGAYEEQGEVLEDEYGAEGAEELGEDIDEGIEDTGDEIEDIGEDGFDEGLGDEGLGDEGLGDEGLGDDEVIDE